MKVTLTLDVPDIMVLTPNLPAVTFARFLLLMFLI